MPVMENLNWLEPLLYQIPVPPVFFPNQDFQHILGREINSRKPPPKRDEALPEWYKEPSGI